MYDTVGSCQIGLELEFLGKVITDQAIVEESIELNQFIKVKDVTYCPDKQMILFDCEVFEHLWN